MLPRETTCFAALLTAGVIDGTLAPVAFRRSLAGPGPAILLAGTSLFALGSGFGLLAATIPARLFWGRLAFLGVAAVPPAWVLTAAFFRKDSLTRRSRTVLFLIPAISLVIYYTNYHHLYYRTVSLAPPGPLALVSPTPGPWYWIFGLYTAVALLWGNVLYARREGTSERSRRLLLAGSLVPWTAVPLYLLGATHSDPAPLLLTVAGLVFARHLPANPARPSRNRVFQSLHEGILVLDGHNRLVDFNPAARSILRNLSPKALGRPAVEVFQEYPELARQLLATGCRQVDLQLPWGKGLKCYQSRLTNLERRGRTIGKTVLLCDITLQTWRVDELETQARHDALTGIFNRGYLLELGHRLLEQAERYGRPLSAVLLDIDHFKQVNDTYGHSAGDTALKTVAATCAGALRSRDLLGRWGGEEFAVLLPGACPEEAMLVAERMRRRLASCPVALERDTINLTASFGVAGVTKAGSDTSLEDLMRAADQALYRAKNSGRNRVALGREMPWPEI